MSAHGAPFEVIDGVVSEPQWTTGLAGDSSIDLQFIANEAVDEHASKPMAGLRICHLGKYYPPAPGGIETHVQTLARAQAALGAQVSVLCVDHTRRMADLAEGQQISWRDEHDGPVRVTRALAGRSLHRLDFCPGLRDLLCAQEADGTHVLHLHTPNPTMLLAVARCKPKIPLLITHHSDIVRQRVLKWFMRPLERLVYRRAARIQVTSEVYQRASSFLRRYDGRTDVLPLGLDLKTFSKPSRCAQGHAHALRRQHGPPLWLSVGRLVYYKGYHVAIKALRHVPGTLMIVGNGPLEAELKELARREGVADRIVWRGYLTRDELAGAYLASAALWFPSNARSEAFGLVQVEAMAAGCPVLNTHIPGSGVSWVSRDDESGLTVAVNDPLALAAAANRLLNEEGLRARLSQGARQRAASEFDHLIMARRSLHIYRKAMADSGNDLLLDVSAAGPGDADITGHAEVADPSEKKPAKSSIRLTFNDTDQPASPIKDLGEARKSRGPQRSPLRGEQFGEPHSEGRNSAVSASPNARKAVPCPSIAEPIAE